MAHHRRAVRVGDDALGDAVERVGVDLGHDERHVGVHPPRRGVVDDDGAGRGDAGGELRERWRRPRTARCRARRSRRSSASSTTISPSPPGQRAAGRAGRREERSSSTGKPALGEDRAHHAADLAGGADDLPHAWAHRLPAAPPSEPTPQYSAVSRRASARGQPERGVQRLHRLLDLRPRRPRS